MKRVAKTIAQLGMLTATLVAIAVPSLQAQEIDIQGNLISIPNGDTTPSTTDGTDFGILDVAGEYASQTFIINNLGTQDLVLPNIPRVEILGNNPGDFVVTATPGSPIAPGSQVSLAIKFDPISAGMRDAIVSIATNDLDEDPFTFMIQGVGDVQPQIEIQGNGVTILNGDNTPNPIDNTYLGDVDAAAGSTTKSYTIVNYGSADLILDGSPKVLLQGIDAADFSVTLQPAATIPAGSSTTFEITFDPSVIDFRDAAVSITSNDPVNDPYQFAIEGNGIGPGAPLACVPNFFHIYGDNGTFTYLDASTSPYTYTVIATAGYHINGVGYNLEDGLLYGCEMDNVISGTNIIKLDATGTITVLPVSVPFEFWRADFNTTGDLHFINGNGDQVGIFDVSASSITTHNLSGVTWRPIDMAYIDAYGKFYGVHQNDLYTYDPASYTVSRITITGKLVDGWNSGVNSDYYGAAWSANDGFLYVANSQSGRFYKIDPTTGASVYVGQGEANLNKSDGASCPLAESPLPNSGTVGNKVWLDANSNGVQDAGEIGVSGVTVRLYEIGDILIDTKYTDDNGEYEFRNLAPSEYYLEFSNVPTGFGFSAQDAGGNDATDSDADPTTGKTANFSVVVGVIDDSRDAGLTTIGIGDRVWLDSDGDGRQDASETAGVQGVLVQLYNADISQVVATTVTDYNGGYEFGNLSAGTTYRIFIDPNDLPGGYVFGQQDNTSWSWDDTEDSDFNQSTGYSGTYTLTAGEFDGSVDAGIYPQTYPEISIEGNANVIVDGDITPSTADHTDFGSTSALGGTIVRTFTIYNTNSADLSLLGNPLVAVSGSQAADFTVTQMPTTPIANGGATTFQITFDPSGVGIRSATVSIANNDSNEDPYDFAIQGTGQAPEIQVEGNGTEIVDGDNAPTLSDHTDFGSTDVVDGSDLTRTFTIRNLGAVDLSLTGTTPFVSISGLDAGDFNITATPASTIIGADSTTFSVTFNPSAEGLRSANLTIANNDLDEDPYTFAIQGTGTLRSEIAVTGNGVLIVDGDTTPGAGDDTYFNSHSISTGSETHTFTITNSGTGPLSFTEIPAVIMTGTNPGDFVVTSQPVGPVAVGGSTSFDIKYDPTTVGTRLATVSIANDDSDEDPYTFDVSGDATALIEIDVQGNLHSIPDGDATPYPIDLTDFGNVDTLTGIKIHTFYIQNTGADSLTLTGNPAVVLGGMDAPEFHLIQPAITKIPANGVGTTFQVKFNPSSLGLKTATLSIANDDPNEDPYNFTIQGTGAVSPNLKISGAGEYINNEDNTPSATDNTDFGAWDVTGESQTHSFLIENTGTAVLSLTGAPYVQITGPNASDFSVTQQPPVGNVAIGGSIGFQITFDPSGRGDRQATVQISSNDESSNPFTFAILGQGKAPEMEVQGNSLTIASGDVTPVVNDGTDFGTTAIGTPVDHNFTIRNMGNLVLLLTGTNPYITFSGSGASDFSVQSAPANSIIAGGSTTFTIRFDPSVAGTRTATLSIANDDQDENPYTFDIQGYTPTPAQLSISKTVAAATDTVLISGNVSYTIQVSNVGGTSGTVTAVRDTLPAGFSYNGGSSAGLTTSDPAVSGQVLTWSGNWSIDASGGAQSSLSLTFSATAAMSAGTYTNLAGVDESGSPGAFTGPTAAVVVEAAPSGAYFTIDKTVSTNTVSSGSTVDFTITVYNGGGAWAQSQSVSDTLPAGFTYVNNSTVTSSNWAPGNPTINGQVLTWTENEYLTYNNGEALTVSFTANTPIQNGTFFNRATVNGVEYQGPAISATTGPTAPVTVLAPELTLTKTVDLYSAMPGDTLTYTVVYMNIGTDPATSVIINELIPANTSYVDSSAQGIGMTIEFSQDNGTSYNTTQDSTVTNIRYTLGGSLAVDGSGTVEFKVRVR